VISVLEITIKCQAFDSKETRKRLTENRSGTVVWRLGDGFLALFCVRDAACGYSPAVLSLEQGLMICVCVCQELTSNPQFFVGGASRFDVQQGELGNITLMVLSYTSAG